LFDGALSIVSSQKKDEQSFDGKANKPPLNESEYEHEARVNPRPSLEVFGKETRCENVYDEKRNCRRKIQQD
jgi:hypothetical protein